MTLLFVIAIVVMVALVGSLPTWRHSRNWGYYPFGGISVIILIIVLIALFTGHLRMH
jgi:hypothetical protein